jgi:hypothetical protein
VHVVKNVGMSEVFVYILQSRRYYMQHLYSLYEIEDSIKCTRQYLIPNVRDSPEKTVYSIKCTRQYLIPNVRDSPEKTVYSKNKK